MIADRGAMVRGEGRDHAHIDDRYRPCRSGGARGGGRGAAAGVGAGKFGTAGTAPPPAAAHRGHAVAAGSAAMRRLARHRAPRERRYRGAAVALLVGVALTGSVRAAVTNRSATLDTHPVRNAGNDG